MKAINYLKHVSILLSYCILFQSCYSYKTIKSNEKDIELLKKYKIDLKNSKRIKGKIVGFYNDTVQILSKGKNLKISEKDIKEIKKRKFSLLKTSLTTLTVAAVSALAIFGISFNIFKKDFNPFKNII
ncbi:hypothetical protein LPB136_06765 [Tenacibaculum todarodis]|uniref:Lipoprotein n=1 Tax=Tenacibaculum todarodis TaxID=1850252 RepID=A0A1L3JIY0_9FLAO|nr:hypothetical protein [Tenacibaculum todarodis]APG65067.1 hypothetical protein LPB136_06765 [Tenacibaculum todarodis]